MKIESAYKLYEEVMKRKLNAREGLEGENTWLVTKVMQDYIQLVTPRAVL
jgi:hypothetical protein